MLNVPENYIGKELILVYNANATVFAVTADFFHKLFSPETYQCNLCRVTYGPIAMKKEWREYLDGLPYKILFYHKDQFMRLSPDYQSQTFPVIFIRAEGKYTVLMSTDEINSISTVDELKEKLASKLATVG